MSVSSISATLARPFEALSLRAKLSLTLISTIVLVAAALLLFLRSSVVSFQDYLANVDAALLRNAASLLEQRYETESGGTGWDFKEGPLTQWLMQARSRRGPEHPDFAFSDAPPPLARGQGSPNALPPAYEFVGPNLPPQMFESRLVLRDTAGQFIAGNPAALSPLLELPLHKGSAVIGTLGLLPVEDNQAFSGRWPAFPGAPGMAPGAAESEALWRSQFLDGQLQLSATLLAVTVIVMLLLALPLGNNLNRRILRMVHAAQYLSEGDFSHRIAVEGKDELARLSRGVNALAEALQRNREAQREWVSNISHELRTPLGVLKGELEAIQDGIRSPTDSEIALLCGEVDQLNRLINDLFTLSMADLGALDFQLAPVRIAGILRDSAASFRDPLARKGLQLSLMLDDLEQVHVMADRQRLLQLFANLLANTLKYTQAPGRVTIRGRIADGHVEIITEDSAPGVAREQLSRLFERLYRAEFSRSRSTGGAGLGLAICRSIAEAHQGTIEARASSLGGLAMHVRLPVS